jgi:hypothetical protein
MSSSGRIKLSKIRKMLAKCAPGYTEERKTHHLAFLWEGVSAHLPRGGHGETNPEIEVGHVKHLVRLLGIDPDCVGKNLKQMQGNLKKKTQTP